MGQILDMNENIFPQGRQDLLSGLLQNHGLSIGTNHTDHKDPCI